MAFPSKVIEQEDVKQLSSVHMVTHNLHTPSQFVFQALNSIKTTLIKILSDILVSLDGSQGVILILLYLSAALDTIDHNILLSRLQSLIGLTGIAY